MIPDAGHESEIEPVATADAAETAGQVCLRSPGKSGHRFGLGWCVPARTGATSQLDRQLVQLGAERMTAESTSDRRRIWWRLSKAAGLSVQLVNARDVKNAPVRTETDKLDAVRLGKWPRQRIRLREDLTRECGRYWQRLENCTWTR